MDKKYCLGLYEKAMPGNLTMAEKLTAAREAGYDYLEMSVDETDEKLARLDMSREERKELTLLMEKTGMPIRSMCLSGHRRYSLGSAEGAEQSLRIMEKAIELADDLGIRIIQLAGYDVYYESSTYDTKKRFLDNLRKAAAMAEQAGVLLGFETMETEFMNTVEKAMKYVCLVDSPYLQIYPDIGNLTNAAVTYKQDIYDDMALGKGHLIAMHLKETVPGKFREIPFGEGHVDFEKAVRKAWELNIRRYVTEFWYTGNLQWKEELLHTCQKFNKLLEEISNS